MKMSALAGLQQNSQQKKSFLKDIVTCAALLSRGVLAKQNLPERTAEERSSLHVGAHHHQIHMDTPVGKLEELAGDIDMVQQQQQQPPDPNNQPEQQLIFQVEEAQEEQQKELKDREQEVGGEGREMQDSKHDLGGNKEQAAGRGGGKSKAKHKYTTDELQFFMGLSLVTGFVFMMFVDQCSGGHGHPHISADSELCRHKRKNMTATIGLVVHAAADGLALGAAAGLSKVDVELIIFMAIMLHKAPAAFGFTSFLIHEGYDRVTAKRHLLVFALSAPVASFIAYFGLVKVLYIIQLPFTGIAMLFSAGTFLYVATVHVLSELTHGSSSSTSDLTGTNSYTKSQLNRKELLLVTIGALLPLLFSAFHSHGH